MPKQQITAVLFDLDGTLIDTAADFIRIIHRLAEQHGWQPPSSELIREQVSAGAAAMVKLMLTHNKQPLTDTDVAQYRQQFLDEYEADICVNSGLFNQLNVALEYFETNDIPWGIVTNKPRYLASKLLEELQLNKRCAVLVCPDDVCNTKPDPEPMYLALEKLGLPHNLSDTIIYVGDHIRDIQAGNNANMITVLASYGYIPPQDQGNLDAWQANHIVHTPEQLVTLLKSTQFDYSTAAK